MIKLFDVNDKDFKTNGIMSIMPLSLIEYKDTSLNGWKIETEIPIKYNDDIQDGMIAYIETKSKGGQPFRITNIKRTDKTLQINANHIVFDSKDYVLEDVRPTNMSAAGALKYVNDRTETPSLFTTNSNVSGVNTAYFINKTLLEAFDTIQDRWGGVYDVDNFLIELRSKVGVDRGDTIMYGKNLEGLSVYEDWSAVVTKLLPVGFDGITLPEKYLYSENDYGRPFTKVVRFETELDEDDRNEAALIRELRENAIAYLKENEVPKISYEIESNVNQQMGIGDTIHVKHPVVDILTEVIAYEYNVLTKRVEKITFGNYRRSVEKKVNVIKDIINKIEDKTNSFDVIIQDQTELINSLNKYGYVYQDDNQIMIVDKLPKEEAKKVWRWNAGGLGYSKNGIEGPFEYAWTMDGTFNTNFISANSIMTNQLHSDVGSGLDISSNKSITQIVENIDRIRLGENLIYNMNGEYDMEGWDFVGNGMLMKYKTRWYLGDRFGSNFIPVTVPSLSQYGIKFVANGVAKTSKCYVVPMEDYSYRGKKHSGSASFDIDVVEFNSSNQQIKKTTFRFDASKQYNEFTIKASQNTMYMQLWYNYNSTNEMVITEQMFNSGEPAEYRTGSMDAKMYAQSKVEQLDDKITSSVTRIDRDLSQANSKIDQQADMIELRVEKDGVIGSINVSQEGLKISSGKLEFDNATGQNVNLSGRITASSGKIGGFDISGTSLVGSDVSLKPNEINVGNATIKGSFVGSVRSIEFQTSRFNVKSIDGSGSSWFMLNDKSVIAHTGDLILGTIDGVSPNTSGYGIGNNGKRYSTIFLQNQPNVSSDKRYKKHISNIDDMLLDEFEHLYEKSFVTNHDGMFSFGYIAQDVERCLYKYIVKVWGYSEANTWLGRFKLLSQSESYKSLLYAEVQVIMMAVMRRKIEIQDKKLNDIIELLESRGV